MSAKLTQNEIDKRMSKEYVNRNGLKFKIIEWVKPTDVTVQFEDGVIRHHISYGHCLDGKVGHPNYLSHRTKKFVDEVFAMRVVNTKGYSMKVVEYNSSNDITVQFEDGVTVEHTRLKSFKNGNILHPNCMNLPKGEYERRMNMVITNTAGRKMRIHKYRTSTDIDIIFEDGKIREKLTYFEFAEGSILHPDDTIGILMKKDDEEVIVTTIYGQYKRGAKERGYSFNLTRKDIKNIIHKPCYYCGATDSNVKKYRNYNKSSEDNVYREMKYNGIDRVDNNIGYEPDNIVPCCKTCNIAKSTMPQNEFYQWVNNVFNYSKNKIEENIY